LIYGYFPQISGFALYSAVLLQSTFFFAAACTAPAPSATPAPAANPPAALTAILRPILVPSLTTTSDGCAGVGTGFCAGAGRDMFGLDLNPPKRFASACIENASAVAAVMATMILLAFMMIPFLKTSSLTKGQLSLKIHEYTYIITEYTFLSIDGICLFYKVYFVEFLKLSISFYHYCRQL
jgi:hypothetical protein